MIRLLKKAMQFVCLALMLVVLMAVVSVADGDMPLLNGVILFISCLLGVNTCLGICYFLLDILYLNAQQFHLCSFQTGNF